MGIDKMGIRYDKYVRCEILSNVRVGDPCFITSMNPGQGLSIMNLLGILSKLVGKLRYNKW